ncbi:hypothetical protein [Neoroseomonas soli]|uniref:Uncharacterized protein n=1 Tax=Neoroseomonas soli TaxID=1081025 RepID=A0A9X9WY06_9PROT|nr:hypothetical protein [Neoroseomonas soli]MBR0672035.1 hypothetical protein [Neoroseomonas soli]
MNSVVAFALSPDGLIAAIELPTDPTPSVMQFDAAELDELITCLGRLRESMSDRVPEQLEPVFRAPRVRTTHWIASSTDSGPGLSLRDPGFGWLHFLITPGQCRDLAASLLHVAGKTLTQ